MTGNTNVHTWESPDEKTLLLLVYATSGVRQTFVLTGKKES